MQLAPSSRTYVSDSDYSWLGNAAALTKGRTRTFYIGDMVESVHYPNGRLLPGLFVAKYVAGSVGDNAGLWGPYYDDWSDTEETGLDTLTGIVLDAGQVDKDADGALVSNYTAAAVLIIGQEVIIKRGNLPAMVLEDGSTAFVPDAANITTDLGFIDDDEGQVF